MKRGRSAPGFTLIELMIATLLLAVAILSVLSVFFALLKAPQKGVDVTTGVMVAESEMEKYLRLYDNDLNDSKKLHLDNLPTGNNSLSASFRKKVSLSQIDYSVAIYSEIAGPSELNMRLVSAYVWWWGGADDTVNTGSKEGYGRLMVQVTRLLSTNNRLVEY